MKKNKLGFTLIELLVVVLIIGVLAAIALPQYQKAVMRSRFNALMPIVKAMADANEAYYLEHNNYASNPQDLLIQGKLEYPTGTELEFGNSMEYAYVLASNPSVKNNYIVYQKHSENFPGEIHCEALEGDEQAEYICESAGGTQNIGTSITEGYTTYILSGEGMGITLAAAEDATNPMSCTKAISMGFSCTSDETTGVKKICTTVENGNYCRTKTYKEDGSYTNVTCQANSEGVCTDKWYSSIYDANGNLLRRRGCSSVNSSGNCTSYGSYGHTDYTYDANGNLLRERSCSSVNSNTGECTSSYSFGISYTYDANGNKLTDRYCSDMSSSGYCKTYSSSGNYDYTYDANGNVVAQRGCSSVDSSGNCTAYDGTTFNYTYDENGNRVTRRQCNGSGADSSGNCTVYASYGNYDYTYDENGNMVMQRDCSGVSSTSGKCSSYIASNSVDYTYDANGNQLTRRDCNSVGSSGYCSSYSYVTYNTYDDNGKQIASQSCYGNQFNKDTGECTSSYVVNVSNY